MKKKKNVNQQNEKCATRRIDNNKHAGQKDGE